MDQPRQFPVHARLHQPARRRADRRFHRIAASRIPHRSETRCPTRGLPPASLGALRFRSGRTAHRPQADDSGRHPLLSRSSAHRSGQPDGELPFRDQRSGTDRARRTERRQRICEREFLSQGDRPAHRLRARRIRHRRDHPARRIQQGLRSRQLSDHRSARAQPAVRVAAGSDQRHFPIGIESHGRFSRRQRDQSGCLRDRVRATTNRTRISGDSRSSSVFLPE